LDPCGEDPFAFAAPFAVYDSFVGDPSACDSFVWDPTVEDPWDVHSSDPDPVDEDPSAGIPFVEPTFDGNRAADEVPFVLDRPVYYGWDSAQQIFAAAPRASFAPKEGAVPWVVVPLGFG
jgi:hypothetical protein